MNDGTITTPLTPTNYTLDFKVAGTANLKADCNTGSGPYTLDGNRITLGPFAMTMMACPEGSMDSQFMKGLGEVASYLIQGDKLVLELKLDSGSMVFLPIADVSTSPASGAAPTLQGKAWLWQQTLMNDGTKSAPANPEDYALMFLPAGILTIRADCNSGSGTYKVDGNNLTITLGAMTMMACPEGTLDSTFLKNLGDVSSYLMQGSNLILELKLDSGSMTFAPKSGNTSAAALMGPVWKWQSPALEGNGSTVGPDRYTLEFLSTGKLNILADCNKAGGTYTADNGALTINAEILTRMSCPEGSLSNEYIQQLNQAGGYFMDGSLLYLTTKDGGMLKFSA